MSNTLGRAEQYFGAESAFQKAQAASTSIGVDIGSSESVLLVTGSATLPSSNTIIAPQKLPGRHVTIFCAAAVTFPVTTYSASTDQTGRVIYHTGVSVATNASGGVIQLVQLPNGGWALANIQ